MQIQCPLCEKWVDRRELRVQWGEHGALECPECHQWVRFSQPHPVFRNTFALALSGAFLFIVGLRNIVLLLIGTIVIGPLLSGLLSIYFERSYPRTMFVKLVPYVPRGSPLQIFGNRRR
jgi:hypothetical protein